MRNAGSIPHLIVGERLSSKVAAPLPNLSLKGEGYFGRFRLDESQSNCSRGRLATLNDSPPLARPSREPGTLLDRQRGIKHTLLVERPTNQLQPER